MEDTTSVAVLDRMLEASGCKKDSEIARYLGKTPQAVSKARQSNKIPVAWVPKIAVQFNVSTDWLFWGDGIKAHKSLRSEESALSKGDSCPGCAALERILEMERRERQVLNDKNAELRAEVARLQERLRALQGEGPESMEGKPVARAG